MVKTKMIKTRMCLGCAKVGNDDNDNCMGGDEKSDDDFFFLFRLSGSFCGAAILQRLSHHSCACDGVPLLQDDCDDDVDKNEDDDGDSTIILMCLATYFYLNFSLCRFHNLFISMTMVLSLCIIYRRIQYLLYLKHFIEITFGLGLRPCQQVEESYPSYPGRQRG